MEKGVGKKWIFALIIVALLSVSAYSKSETASLPVVDENKAAPELTKSDISSASKIHSMVKDAIEESDEITVIVKLNDDSRFLSGSRDEILNARRQASFEARREFFDNANSDFDIVYKYNTLSALAVRVNSEELLALQENPAVQAVYPNLERRVSLSDSVPLINADVMHETILNGTSLSGSGQTICIIDTGIDYTHPAFAGKIVGGYDFINNDANASDDNGHGTHVAGIALGNASPVIGVAPDAKVFPVKVCNSGGGCPDAAILAGIDACNGNVSTYNISVISGSLGGFAPYNSTTCPTDPAYAAADPLLNTSLSLGIIPVFASGNNGCAGGTTGCTTGVDWPACMPQAVSVGATNDADVIQSFTNRGGDRLDIWAPGSNIISAAVGGGTAPNSGTSMATPHVSGAIAILNQVRQANGKSRYNITETREILNGTGVDISDPFNNATRIDVEEAAAFSVTITGNTIRSDAFTTSISYDTFTNFSNASECIGLYNNLAEVDSATCPEFNKSAHVLLHGISAPARPVEDNALCGSKCTNAAYKDNALEFDVTSFSNFTSITGCSQINSSVSLNQSIYSNGTCIIFGNDNITLDCAGFTVGFDAVSSGSASGILAGGRNNITIRNCIIQDLNSTGTNGWAINLTNTNSSSIYNNTMQTNGTGNNHGLYLFGSSNNASDLLVRTLGSSSYGVYISGSQNIFSGIVLNDTIEWIFSASGSDNNFTNTTFLNPNGSIVPGAFTMNGLQDVNRSRLNISNNTAFVNSSNLTFLNVSSRITLNGITFSNPLPIVDFQDDGSFISCDVPQCTEVSYSSGAFIFDVLGFSTYSSNQTIQNVTLLKIDSPDPVVKGQQLNYTITINNSGTAAIYNVTLNDTLPAGVIFDSSSPAPVSGTYFDLGNITAGQVVYVNITVNVSSSLTNGTVLNNTANLSFTNASWQNVSVAVSQLTTVLGYPELLINKTDNPDPVKPNETLTYTINVTNVGDDTAFNVTVNESYPAQVAFNGSSFPPSAGNNVFNFGNLSPGQSQVLTITVNVSSGLANGTLLNNSLNVSYFNSSSESAVIFASENTTVRGVPLLSTNKTASPDPVVKGSLVNFTVSVTNYGNDTAFNVTVAESYPNGTSYSSSSHSPTIGDNVFSIGSIAPNETKTVNISLSVSTGITNNTVLNNSYNVTFEDFRGLQSTVSNQTNFTVLGYPSIVVTKVDSIDPVQKGTNLVYTITVRNDGDDTAFNVTLVDTLPSAVVFNNSQPAPDVGNTTFLLGNLSPGDVTTVNMTVNVTASKGSFTNNVEVTYSSIRGDNTTASASEKTSFPAPVVQGGGGGGGGGGGVLTRYVMETDSFKPPYLRQGSKVEFVIDGEAHTLTILSVLARQVRLRVESYPQDFALRSGNVTTVDVNLDGTPDLRISVLDIAYSKVLLQLDKLAQSVVVSEPVKQEKVEPQPEKKDNEAPVLKTPEKKKEPAPVKEPVPVVKEPESKTNVGKMVLIAVLILILIILIIVGVIKSRRIPPKSELVIVKETKPERAEPKKKPKKKPRKSIKEIEKGYDSIEDELKKSVKLLGKVTGKPK